jgi:hypothetical protein
VPVRKIPKNYLKVTGGFASRKNGCMIGFESLLERDYMILLEYDDAVERFEEQPVKIPFKKGVKPYVPDILIHYGSNHQPRRSLLAEVKHTSDLARNHDEYAPKFALAQEYAAERDWDFRVITEKEIRTPRLASLKFLREYLNVDPEPGHVGGILAALEEEGRPMALNVLLDRLCESESARLQIVPVIWHLAALQQIMIDLEQPIDDKTQLSLPQEGWE